MIDTFWQTIDKWSTNGHESAIHFEHVDFSKEMLAECEKYNSYKKAPWRPITRPRYEMVWNKKSQKLEKTNEIFRYYATPNAKDFPILNSFLKNRADTYHKPEISLLMPGGCIFPHNHASAKVGPDGSTFTEEWLYNMSINYPKGCRFGVYPSGLVPYTPGDVYKIRVSQYHSVINDSDTIRYHVVMRTKETMQYWHGESYA